MLASWNVTNECNLFCEHCYRDAGKEHVNELTTQEGKDLLTEIAKAGFKLTELGVVISAIAVFGLGKDAKQQRGGLFFSVSNLIRRGIFFGVSNLRTSFLSAEAFAKSMARVPPPL